MTADVSTSLVTPSQGGLPAGVGGMDSPREGAEPSPRAMPSQGGLPGGVGGMDSPREGAGSSPRAMPSQGGLGGSSPWASTETGRLVLPTYERPAGVHPPLDFEGYRSTALRHPKQPLVLLPHRLTEVTGPLLGDGLITATDSDLTTQHDGEPQGQRIILTGRVLDSDGRPVPDTLVEIWQTNAGGRYRHSREHHPAPLDPNFDGIGRAITDAGGRYRFVTIAPGSYPWGNHYNAWRPAHIHFSLFGRAFTQRLVTQMYFPGDPLLPLDPIFNSVPDEKARQRMIADFDIELTQPEWALGYHWDIVLRGRDATAFE